MDATSDEKEVSALAVEETKLTVNQINGNVSTANGTKRKLPVWMVKSSNDDSEDSDDESTILKRCKALKRNDAENVVGSNEVTVPKSEENNKNEIENGETEEASSSNLADSSLANSNLPVTVKAEPVEPDDSNNIEATSSNVESNVDSNVNASIADVKPAVKIEKADATSTSRESCKYGIRCYRRNPMHRAEQAHPGDHDYKRPNYPPPPDGVPDCPWGNRCYRRNPIHFQKLKHPDDTDFQQNYKNYCLRQRKRRRQQNQQKHNNNDGGNNDDSDLDDYDLEDPFINDDSDLDYMPSSDEEDLDYDDCDKAEE